MKKEANPNGEVTTLMRTCGLEKDNDMKGSEKLGRPVRVLA